MFTKLGNWFDDLFTKLGNWFDDLFTKLGNWFNDLFTKLENWFKNLWENIDNGLKTLSDNIVGKITSVGDWLEERENQRRIEKEEAAKKEEEQQKNNKDESSELINDTVSNLTNKFNFIDNVKTNVNDMISVITDDTKIPKFEINVKSKWYAGTVTVVDLSWYDEYREYGDNVICIFCYLGFLWNIFIKLPDIISGAGASSYVVDMAGDIKAYRNTGFGRSSNIIGKR